MSAWEGSKAQEQWEEERKERERREEEERKKRDTSRRRAFREVIRVRQQSEMPRGPHWAILKYVTVQEPGYEGGSVSVPAVNYDAYMHKEDWEAAILELEERVTREPYTAMEVKPASVRRTVSVGIE